MPQTKCADEAKRINGAVNFEEAYRYRRERGADTVLGLNFGRMHIRRLSMKKIFRTKYIVYVVLLCLLSVSIICFAISYKKVTIGISNVWDDTPEEITVRLGNGESYEITKETYVIDHDQFLPEYSVVDYPTIKFSDDAINDRLGEKINRIFYETAMLNYDEELGQQINAEYACYYDIANADEDYISIFYHSTAGAGGGVDNRCYAVTVSLADGSEVSLTDLMSMDEIAHRLADYRGTIYMEPGYSIDIWLENKEEFIEKWLGDERSPLHGWYLYEGRIGFFFWYPRGSHMNILLEFSGIIDYF